MSKFDWVTPNTSITAIVNHFGSSHGDLIKGLEAREAWQPMDTAPLDLIVLVKDEDTVYEAAFRVNSYDGTWTIARSPYDEWRGTGIITNPKGWKPLPKL